jgi:CubicO group peptidase (beta-lactamase class C family)
MKHHSIAIIFFLCLTLSYGQEKKVHSDESLQISTPEAEGVSPAGILKFLDAADSGRNEIHSFVIVRHGKIVSEGWWNPYSKDLRHVMFSVSKSFTSTGVGLAIAEKKLALTDKVVSFFPQSLPDTLSAFMKAMTVEDLLKMSAGMDTDPIGKARGSSDWVKAFLSSAVEHKPGTVFKYNNMATFMLSAIVQKATGEKLLDYLRPRLFDQLGFRNVSWDETPEGYTFGAIGLKLQSEDMAKFGQLVLQKGKWNGKQLIPQGWVEQATSFKIASDDPSNKTPAELNDWKQGYCYQFWRCRNNAYRADGLGGQFIIVMPEKDAVVVLTCSATNTQEVLDLVWANILPAMRDKPLLADSKTSGQLKKKIASLKVKIPAGDISTDVGKKVSGKRIEFAQNETGVQALTLRFENGNVQFQVDRGGNEKFDFVAARDTWIPGQSKLFTLAAAPRVTQARPAVVASRYSWIDGSTLELASKFPEESIGTDTWVLRFEETATGINVHVEIKGMRPRMLEGKIVN